MLLGVFLSLLLIAELAENKVATIALNRINEGVDATISVGNIDLSLITNLPDATLEFSDVEVITPGDTLTQIERLYISVELWPLLKSRFNITEISLEGGWLNYQVDSLGKSNFDVFLAVPEEQEADTTTNELFLSLKHLALNNIFFSYTDKSSDINACLYIDEGLSKVYIDNNNQKAAFKGVLRANQCQYPQSKLHLMEELKVELDVSYFNDKLTIAGCDIETDGARLKANGEIHLADDIYTDVRISSSVFDIRELSKYIPDTLLSNYDVRHVAGIATLQANIKGIYNDSVMPKIDAWLQLNEGSVALGNYPAVNHIKFTGMYSNGELMNNETTQLAIDTLSFAAGGSRAFVTANIQNLDAIAYRAKAKLQIDLGDIYYHLPDSVVDGLSGQMQLHASTQGQVPETIDEHFADYVMARTHINLHLADVGVQMDSVISLEKMNGQLSYGDRTFRLNDFSVRLPDYGLSVTKANVAASYNGQLARMNTLGLNISNFDIATVQSRFKGEASFSHPDYPEYRLDATAKLGLSEWMAFAPDSLLKSMTGSVSASLKTAGRLHLDSIANNLMETLFMHSELSADLNDVGVEMDSYPVKISHLSGKVGLSADSLNLETVSGDFNGITFDADSSFVKHIYTAYWLNQPDTIMAEGYFNFGDIDYAMFEPFMVEEVEEEPTEAAEPAEPARYHFAAKGKLSANSFWYDNALLENMSALYNVSDSLYIADQIKIDAFKGHMNSSIRVEMLPDDGMTINFKNSTKGLDINQLLYDFDDFMDYTDEVYISHNQLSGLFSTDNLNGELTFKGDSIDMNLIKLTANLTLENGRLSNYPITTEMGKDYNIDGLEDLQFKTLDTKVFIYKQAVYMPMTNVKSNTFDITLFGRQDFNLDCQYHLRFYLKEILRKGKTNRLERKQSKEDKVDDYGGTKGLTSMFAIYKVVNGDVEKSFLEGKKSEDRRIMQRLINNKEGIYEFYFKPKFVKYNTKVLVD